MCERGRRGEGRYGGEKKRLKDGEALVLQGGCEERGVCRIWRSGTAAGGKDDGRRNARDADGAPVASYTRYGRAETSSRANIDAPLGRHGGMCVPLFAPLHPRFARGRVGGVRSPDLRPKRDGRLRARRPGPPSPAGRPVLPHLPRRPRGQPLRPLGLPLPALEAQLRARLPRQLRRRRPGPPGVPALQDRLPRQREPVGAGERGVQGGGEPVLHEHVPQHRAAGAHRPGQILEAEGAGQSAERPEGGAVGAQLAVELGGVRRSVGPGAGGAGAHDRRGGGPRGERQVLPVQVAQRQRERQSLLQRADGGAVLARLRRAGGVLREHRVAAAGGVAGQSGPPQRAEIQTDRQEVLLRPVPVRRVLRALPRLPAGLHRLPAQRGGVLRPPAAGGPHQRGDAAAFRLQQLLGPRHVLPLVRVGAQDGPPRARTPTQRPGRLRGRSGV